MDQDISFPTQSGLAMCRFDDPFATAFFDNDFVAGLHAEPQLQILRQLNAPDESMVVFMLPPSLDVPLLARKKRPW